MNILIVGGGTIGRITAEYFSREGHSVTVVEHDPERIRTLQDQLDIVVVEGKGTDQAVLKSANIDGTELFLALTDNDESNIISCTLAKFAGVPRKIARINDMQVLAMKDNPRSFAELGIDEIVNTGEALIHEIRKLVRYPGMTDIHHYLDNKYIIAKFSFSRTSPHFGSLLRDIPLPEGVMPLGFEQVGSFQPYNDSVRANEFLYVYYSCETKDFPALYKALAPNYRPVRSVMIYGGGYKSRQTGGALGTALKEEGVTSVELVEEDADEARKLSAKYPFKVIHDDPTLPHFARSGNLKNVDLFLGISGNFEKNLYACSVAYREQVPYTIAFVRYPEHTGFVSAIPITEFINPALVTANKVLRYHEADTIVSRTILEYNSAECLEFHISPKSKFAGKRVNALPFIKSRCIVLLREGALVDMSVNPEIRPDDRLLFLLVNGEADTFRSSI